MRPATSGKHVEEYGYLKWPLFLQTEQQNLEPFSTQRPCLVLCSSATRSYFLWSLNCKAYPHYQHSWFCTL